MFTALIENVEPGENLHPGAYSQGESGLELYNLDTDIGESKIYQNNSH